MKKKHNDIVRGVSTIEGDVIVYTPQPAEPGSSRGGEEHRRRDKRHRINTEEELKKFTTFIPSSFSIIFRSNELTLSPLLSSISILFLSTFNFSFHRSHTSKKILTT